ncbi:hypothetical protein CYMTET_6804 [Cymbomonas tetramitiformis]|uniref:Uncharacterized protein n=1 Tax=Cymbomonas tetramitiformis TaxID=36881 RepID=A0AAE0GWQ8_9CHLO|nr:hypothetical protein CYMTET_6804 [Cymbomonas tetramitiformis]
MPAAGKLAQVAAGKDKTCAVLEDRSLACWGLGAYEQMANDYSLAEPLEDPGLGWVYLFKTPPPPIALAGSAVQVATGAYHNCAIVETSSADALTTKATITTTLTNVNTVDNGRGSVTTSIATSTTTSSMVISTTSAPGEDRPALIVECWGHNPYGQLGVYGGSITGVVLSAEALPDVRLHYPPPPLPPPPPPPPPLSPETGRLEWTVRSNYTPNAQRPTPGLPIASHFDAAYAVATDANDNAFIAGELHSLPNPGYSAMFVQKVNAAGCIHWTLQSRGNGTQYARGIAVGSGRGAAVLVVGWFSHTATFGSCVLESVGGSLDAFLLKACHTGTVQWVERIGGPGADVARAVAIHEEDGRQDAFVVGTFGSGNLTFGGQSITGTGTSRDAFVLMVMPSPSPFFETPHPLQELLSMRRVTTWTSGGASGRSLSGLGAALLVELRRRTAF